MEITIKHREFASVVKGTAKMILPLTSSRDRIIKKIKDLYQEYEEVNTKIASYQNHVMEISGGLTTDQLVVRKADAEGKLTTQFIHNPEFVRFDEEKRMYVVTIPEENKGSDFDADKEQAPMTEEERQEANDAEEQMHKEDETFNPDME